MFDLNESRESFCHELPLRNHCARVRFNPLASAVVRLPELTGTALASAMDFNRAARAISGLPLMSKIRQLATRVQSLVEDVHSEATDLFTACVLFVCLSVCP